MKTFDCLYPPTWVNPSVGAYPSVRYVHSNKCNVLYVDGSVRPEASRVKTEYDNAILVNWWETKSLYTIPDGPMWGKN